MELAVSAGRSQARPRESRVDAREARRRRAWLKREFGIAWAARRDPNRAARIDRILADYNELPKEDA